MKCPHCQITFTDSWSRHRLGEDDEGGWWAGFTRCDAEGCKKVIASVQLRDTDTQRLISARLVQPKSAGRPIPGEVPDPYRTDFAEAAITLPDSAKASAALSRRCLQTLIREKAGFRRSRLSDEIDELLKSGQIPSWLGENVDAVRNVGNLAAHETKDTHTGEIVDVEFGEAEWLLDVLDGLFDFYFVQPAVQQRRREALNEKLDRAGKPPLK